MDVTDILKGFPNTGHDVRVDARGKGGVGPCGAEGKSRMIISFIIHIVGRTRRKQPFGHTSHLSRSRGRCHP